MNTRKLKHFSDVTTELNIASACILSLWSVAVAAIVTVVVS